MINMNELKKLGLPTMCANALGAVGVVTYDQLLQVTTLELKAIPNLGSKGIEYIFALVASKGHKLEGQELHEQRMVRKKAKRQWIGLTEEEFSAINQSCYSKLEAAALAESILKRNNT